MRKLRIQRKQSVANQWACYLFIQQLVKGRCLGVTLPEFDIDLFDAKNEKRKKVRFAVMAPKDQIVPF